jgi:hypothetical protein
VSAEFGSDKSKQFMRDYRGQAGVWAVRRPNDAAAGAAADYSSSQASLPAAAGVASPAGSSKASPVASSKPGTASQQPGPAARRAQPARPKALPAHGNSSQVEPWAGATCHFLCKHLLGMHISVCRQGDSNFLEGRVIGGWVNGWRGGRAAGRLAGQQAGKAARVLQRAEPLLQVQRPASFEHVQSSDSKQCATQPPTCPCRSDPSGADTAAEGHDLLVMQVVYDDDGTGKPGSSRSSSSRSQSAGSQEHPQPCMHAAAVPPQSKQLFYHCFPCLALFELLAAECMQPTQFSISSPPGQWEPVRHSAARCA